MKKFLVLSGLALMLCCLLPHRAQAQESLAGEWQIDFKSEVDVASMMVRRVSAGGGGDSRFFNVPFNQLQGITREQAYSDGTPVKFQLRREAGTFICEGRFKGGHGTGHFVFNANSDFADAMKRQGYDNLTTEKQFGLAANDTGETLLRELDALGLERPTPAEFASLSQYGVNAQFIGILTTLGYKPESLMQLIRLRQLGVSVAFIQEFRALGYEHPTLQQLINMREQGVTPQFVNELVTLGYAYPSIDQLINMRMQGVTTKFIKDLEALGYKNVPLNQLVTMKMQGVTIDYIQKLKAEGYENVTADQLIAVRMFGMPAEFIKRMPAASARQASVPFTGEWMVKFYKRGTSVVWFLLRERTAEGSLNARSFEIAPNQLQGLTEAQAFADGASAKFQLVRDAGTFTCEGWFKNGFGAGQFTYNANPNFAAEMRSLGYENLSSETQYLMATHDVGIAFINDLKSVGYGHLTAEQMLRMGMHDAGARYVRELASVGYTNLDTDRVIRLRNHEVTAKFISGLASVGYGHLSVEELVRLHNHGIDAAYIERVKAQGHNNPSVEQLVRLRNHEVER